MRSIGLTALTRATALTVLSLPLATAAFGQATEEKSSPPVKYIIKDLGTLGGNSSSLSFTSDNRISSGMAALPNGTNHAALWFGEHIFDIGTPGLGGQQSASLNSTAFSNNDWAQAAGAAETPRKDPNAENFCGYGTAQRCLPFFWQGGQMVSLPLLGGVNGQAISINKWGSITGVAETAKVDYTCATTKPSQILQFRPVLWNPFFGQVRKLPLLGSDTAGMGLWLNDNGQAVGQSGGCGNIVLPPLAVGPHAVLWEADGSVRDLGNLGGACESLCTDPVLGPFGNTPLFINNKSEVVGLSALSDSGPYHAFLWTKKSGKMKDLGTVEGDAASVALCINEIGEIVGLSLDPTGMPHAFLRKDGKMLDLETLIPEDSPLIPLAAFAINNSEEIGGFGVDPNTGDVHALLAIPVDPKHPRYENARRKRFVPSAAMCKHIQEQLGHRPHGVH